MADAFSQRRVETLLTLRTDSGDAAAKLRDELMRVDGAARAVEEAFQASAITAEAYRTEVTQLRGEWNFYEKQIGAVEQAQAAQTKAMGESISYAGAWGKVIQHVGETMEETARKVAEAAEQERTFAQASKEVNDQLAKDAVQQQKETDKRIAAANKVLKSQYEIIDADRIAAQVRQQNADALAKDTARMVAAADKRIAAANKELVALTADQDGVAAAYQKAAAAEVVANRQRANAIAGVEREQDHLNQLLEEGHVEMVSASRLSADEVAGLKRKTSATKDLASQQAGAGKAANQHAMGVLFLSNAFQDAQYGFAGVLNNIPQITMAYGGSMQLAGGLMAAGVAANILAPNLKQVGINAGLLSDPLKNAAVDTKNLKERIEGLIEKPFKLKMDFDAIDAAEKKLEGIEKRLRAAKGLEDAMDTVHERASKMVKEVITEEGGAHEGVSGKENLAMLVREALRQDPNNNPFGRDPEQLEKEKAERGVKASQERVDAAHGPTKVLMEQELKAEQSRLDAINKRMEDRLTERINTMIGSAALGEEGGMTSLSNIYDKNKKLFRQGFQGRDGRNVAPVSNIFRQGLDEAKPENVQKMMDEEKDDKAEEIVVDGRKFRRQLAKEKAAKEKAAEAEAIRMAKAATDDVDDAKKKADKLEADALDDTVNDAWQHADKEAHRVGGPIKDNLRTAILKRAGRGEGDAEIMQGMAPQVEGAAQLAGVQRDLAGQVAAKIVRDQLAAIRAEMAAGGGGADAAQGLLADQQVKVAGKARAKQGRAVANQNGAARESIVRGLQQTYGATPEQARQLAPRVLSAMQSGIDPAAAAEQVVAQLGHHFEQQQRTMLRMQASQEQMLGIIGPATQQLREIEAQSRMMANQMKPMTGQNRPAMLPRFPASF